jgi:hypothetical protein
MIERMIVARRWDMIPPPGSSARFCWTLESTTRISPRVVTAPPGPSLPPRVSVTFLSSTKPVPSWRSSRVSKHPCRSVCPPPSSETGPDDSRIGSPLRHARSTMSRVTRIAVSRGLAQAARSSRSVPTATDRLMKSV